MGVPITFLDKYCPEQFEILGYTERTPVIAGKNLYKRILIRRVR
ncbi:MAG: adenine-specific methyltransferase EcoRI family protein [Prevotella sp.]|nr:adenine-specific methyltransferase EcoRI family protein [Prevotella sp.]